MNESTQTFLARGRQIIQGESTALIHLAEALDENYVRAVVAVLGCRGTVLVAGLGKSGLVARKWVATMNGTGTAAYYLNPAEALHGDLGMIRASDLLFCLSFSGETEELSVVAKYAGALGATVIAVTGRRESALGSVATWKIALPAIEEACPLKLAPTSSTAAMMALGDAIACTAYEARGFDERAFAKLHPGGSLGRRLWLTVAELMHTGAQLPKVAPGEKLQAVLVAMTRHRLGLAVVVEHDEVKGIITDGDLRRFLQTHGLHAEAVAAEMMTTHPKRIHAEAPALEARQRLEANAIQHLLVFDDEERWVGVVHLQDLLKARVL